MARRCAGRPPVYSAASSLVMKGRECLLDADISLVFPNMLLNDQLDCREVCGWMLCRLSSGRDGTETLIKLDQVKYIIKSFRDYSNDFRQEEAVFLIYLLECMANVLQTDEGIEHFLGTKTMKRFNEVLLLETGHFGQYDVRIRYLCLLCTALMAMNSEGKEESISLRMIDTANSYLAHQDDFILNFAVRVIMFSSIHLEGKVQATTPADDSIIKNLINLLEHQTEEVVINVKQTIVNIADLPKGFKIICKYMSSHLIHLETIFGSTSIVPNYMLLFKVDRPPFLTPENTEMALQFGRAICFFINSDSHKIEALQYAIERTCRIVERLVPLLLYNKDSSLQKDIAKGIEVICNEDEVNRLALRMFLEKHTEFVHPELGSRLTEEVGKYPGLVELIHRVEEDNAEAGMA
jgi:hypothetical protein